MPKALKFSECRGCRHQKTWRCVRCSVGEFFEERETSLDLTDCLSAGTDDHSLLRIEDDGRY